MDDDAIGACRYFVTCTGVKLPLRLITPLEETDVKILNQLGTTRMTPITYFAALSKGKTVLWCYLIWYLVTVFFRFDPSPNLWLNSVGISAVIGVGLLLSVSHSGGRRADRWQTFRLFLMPFCVSSFSSLIKGHGYFLVFPSTTVELLLSLGACVAFVALVLALKKLVPSSAQGRNIG